VLQLLWLEVVFTVLIVDFELGTFAFRQLPLSWIQLGKSLDTMGTVIV
jgi:hypothetical protein